jgi:hypothetical protein
VNDRKIALFWAKVDKSAGPDGCWLWTGCKSDRGYGVFNIGKRRTDKASRIAWGLTHGCPPEDKPHVLHNCPDGDNPACCNPAHLWVGTNAENHTDSVNKGRQARGMTHGHAKLTDEQVQLIRVLARSMTQKAIATQFNISQSEVSDIAAKRIWTHVLDFDEEHTTNRG